MTANYLFYTNATNESSIASIYVGLHKLKALHKVRGTQGMQAVNVDNALKLSWIVIVYES